MNHYSLAFTYDWIASERERRSYGSVGIISFGETIMGSGAERFRNETGVDWRDRWRMQF